MHIYMVLFGWPYHTSVYGCCSLARHISVLIGYGDIDWMGTIRRIGPQLYDAAPPAPPAQPFPRNVL